MMFLTLLGLNLFRYPQQCPFRSQWFVPDVASRCVTASSYWLQGGCGTAPASAAASVTVNCRLSPPCFGETEPSTASRTTAGLHTEPLLSHQFFIQFLTPGSPSPIRLFGGGQCARCFQPIPPTALVMRSGELTFHPHCFSCQVCNLTVVSNPKI